MEKYGIERDLTERVNEKVRTDLVRTEVRTKTPLSEKEFITQKVAIRF
jgi:hypothetical protein